LKETEEFEEKLISNQILPDTPFCTRETIADYRRKIEDLSALLNVNKMAVPINVRLLNIQILEKTNLTQSDKIREIETRTMARNVLHSEMRNFLLEDTSASAQESPSLENSTDLSRPVKSIKATRVNQMETKEKTNANTREHLTSEMAQLASSLRMLHEGVQHKIRADSETIGRVEELVHKNQDDMKNRADAAVELANSSAGSNNLYWIVICGSIIAFFAMYYFILKFPKNVNKF